MESQDPGSSFFGSHVIRVPYYLGGLKKKDPNLENFPHSLPLHNPCNKTYQP